MRRRKRSSPLSSLSSSSSSYHYFSSSLFLRHSLHGRLYRANRLSLSRRRRYQQGVHVSIDVLSNIFLWTSLFAFVTLGCLRLYDGHPSPVLLFSSLLWKSSQDHVLKSMVVPTVPLRFEDNVNDDDDDNTQVYSYSSRMDFGELNLRLLLSESQFRRSIPWNEPQLAVKYRDQVLDDMEHAMKREHQEKHRFDPPQRRRRKHHHEQQSACRALEWTTDSFPTCNTVHEVVTLDRVSRRNNHQADSSSSLYDIKQLGHGGYYRLGFLFAATAHAANDFVLKVLHTDHSMGQEQLRLVTTEALLLGSFTSSERFANVYSHCGTSMLVERGQDLGHPLIPFLPDQDDEDMRGYISTPDLAELSKSRGGMYQGNTLNRGEKLDVAIAISESVLLLHSFLGGPVVQNDITFEQWLYSMDSKPRVMLNDLNSAVPLEWNDEEQTYCAFQSSTGNYKAPEHFLFAKTQTEKADIWPLGCILYGILTGLMPYHEYFEADDLPQLSSQGVPPVLPPLYRERERDWAQLMDQMFVVNVDERMDIYAVVQELHAMKQRYEAAGRHRRRRRR